LKTDLINDINQIYSECSLLGLISFDLTQYDNNDDEKIMI